MTPIKYQFNVVTLIAVRPVIDQLEKLGFTVTLNEDSVVDPSITISGDYPLTDEDILHLGSLIGSIENTVLRGKHQSVNVDGLLEF